MTGPFWVIVSTLTLKLIRRKLIQSKMRVYDLRLQKAARNREPGFYLAFTQRSLRLYSGLGSYS